MVEARQAPGGGEVMTTIQRPYLAYACAWCGASSDPELFRNVEMVDEHFLKKHGKEDDALHAYGWTKGDAAKRALELGFDIEAEA